LKVKVTTGSILVLVCLLLAIPCQARIITVDDNGPADFNNIQAAINDANEHDTVVVFPGTYAGNGNRDIDFLGKAITVRSVNPNNSAVVAATIVDCNGPPAEHHRAFWFQSGEDANSVVDGITISNAYRAAVYCSESGPTIRNCIIKSGFGSGIFGPSASPMVHNCTIVDRAWFGINLYDGGSPTITNCLISGNGQGGINYDGGGSAKIANCIIRDNTGGGIYCGIEEGGAITMEISGCTISGNEGSGVYSGGGYSDPISLTITNCSISGNLAGSGDYHGGGIYCSNPGTSDSIEITVTNCTINGNVAYNDGGGIYCADTSGGLISLTLTNSTVGENWAGYYGGGMYCGFNVSWTITDSTIAGNTAIYNNGGGIYCREHMISHTITNCTISGNSAGGDGGGLWAEKVLKGGPTVTICIISGISAGLEGGGLYGGYTIGNSTITGNFGEYRGSALAYCLGPVVNCIIWGNSGDHIYGMIHPNVAYCNVQGGWPGLGNIDVDPCFVEVGKWVDANDPNIIVEPNEPNAVWIDGDYHLKSQGWRLDTRFAPPRWGYDYVTSRCIDAGNPGSPLGGELLTIPPDPGHVWGENLRINMGAYGGTVKASMPPYDWALLSDITNDGVVDFVDFAHLANMYTDQDDGLPADFDRNGDVDYDDLGLLAEDWLKQTTWHE
jgi:parallel beta-helix repeat protein